MFLSHRRVDLPESKAFLATHAVVHSGYRVHAVFRENVISEDALLVRGFDRRGAVGRPVATLLIEGRARVRVPGHDCTLAPGDLCVIASKGEVLMRQEGARYATLVVEWAPDVFGDLPLDALSVRRPPPETTAPLRALASALVDQAGDKSATGLVGQTPATALVGCIADAWAALRALGVPLHERDAASLTEPIGPAILRLAGALDQLQSNLRGAPMMVDLEAALGLSSRQINRVVQEFNERYGFNAAGWRDTRNRWRLMMGATLMTAPGASADAVARAVGFASAATFTRALGNVDLPPPGEIANLVRTFGEGGPDQAP